MLGEMTGAFAALLFVLGLLGLMVWAMKRFGLAPGQPRFPTKGGKQITIVENRMLDGRNRLVIVRWRGREYLLGSGANGISLIGTEDSDFEKMLEAAGDETGDDQKSL